MNVNLFYCGTSLPYFWASDECQPVRDIIAPTAGLAAKFLFVACLASSGSVLSMARRVYLLAKGDSSDQFPLGFAYLSEHHEPKVVLEACLRSPEHASLVAQALEYLQNCKPDMLKNLNVVATLSLSRENALTVAKALHFLHDRHPALLTNLSVLRALIQSGPTATIVAIALNLLQTRRPDLLDNEAVVNRIRELGAFSVLAVQNSLNNPDCTGDNLLDLLTQFQIES